MDTAKHELSEESGNGKRRLRKRGLNKNNKNSEQKIFCTPQTFQLAKYVGEKADRLQKITPQNNLASIMNFLDLVPNVDVRDTLSIKMNDTLLKRVTRLAKNKITIMKLFPGDIS